VALCSIFTCKSFCFVLRQGLTIVGQVALDLESLLPQSPWDRRHILPYSAPLPIPLMYSQSCKLQYRAGELVNSTGETGQGVLIVEE
jgi:hypothetical protein